MGDIIAPEGSPLSVAVIGVENMEKSVAFYRDVIGLSASTATIWEGEDFQKLWHLPPGSSAVAVFCELPGVNVGRILLLQFNAATRRRVRANEPSCTFGLKNLNFYCDDIRAETVKLKNLGYKFWSDPMHYHLSDTAGAPTEVIFEGPDGVVINLVELTSKDPNTRIGQMRAYVQQHGRTPRGFTPVVTTAHDVRNIAKAAEFGVKVLKGGILIDVVMSTPEQNLFQRLPEKSKTAVKFVQGNHMFGKVALCQPLNYACVDLVSAAVAPNIGYLSQIFMVKDLSEAETACKALRCDIYTPRMAVMIPGLGRTQSLIVRNPGSGALQHLVQL